MSWVDDARKLLQDFVAPELRAMTAQLNAIKELLAAADKASAERYAMVDKLSAERHAALLERLEAATRELSLKIELALVTRKLEELQEKQAANPPH
jgi:DNA-binding transcriptional MerR regulator